MSVKKFTFIVGVVVIFAVLVGLLIFTLTKPSGVSDENNDGGFTNLFPFGDSSIERDRIEDDIAKDPLIEREDLFNSEGFSYGQISKEPIAGAVWIEETEDSPETVRYAERATGHVYDFDIENMNSSRITNTTIPKLFRSFFGNRGESFIGQYLTETESKIETFSSKITKESLSIEDTAIFNNEAISASLSPNENLLAYLVKGKQSSRIVVLNIENSSIREVFSSPFSEWVIKWINNTKILLTTKPSGSVDGFAYVLDINSKNKERILGSKRGLLANISPSEKYILFSKTLDNRELGLFIKDTSSETETFLPIKTLPEKCTWSPNETYIYCAVPVSMGQGVFPDDWYKGSVLFSDEFWVIDTQDETVSNFFSPTQENFPSVDAIDLSLSKSGEFILFKNKIDLTLWGLRVKEAQVPEINQETSRN